MAVARRVGIVGFAQTKHERTRRDETVDGLVFEISRKVFGETGLAREDIDTIVAASYDVLDGRSISNVFTVEAMGGFQKDETKVAEEGAFGVLYAYMRILSGAFDSALVVAYGKSSGTSMHKFTNFIFEPFYQRPLGLDAISTSALQARRYMDKYGITEEQCARVAVKNRRNALNNPYAQLKLDIDIDDVLNSRVLCSPIKLLDACPISDGAAAIILASEEKAKQFTDSPVWIKGIGHCVDTFYLGYRELAEAPAAALAAQNAYKMAGISKPRKEIDVAEVYEAFSYQELMLCEALGFCDKGEGGKLIEEGTTEMHGELPVNPSGGALSANPISATGLIRIGECALQIMGKAGERQVPDVNLALAHGTDGLCLQGNCVLILGGD
jgi:acetyl-CoA C-acetyltransferase